MKLRGIAPVVVPALVVVSVLVLNRTGENLPVPEPTATTSIAAASTPDTSAVSAAQSLAAGAEAVVEPVARRSPTKAPQPSLPLRFEINGGQAEESVDAVVHERAYTLLLADGNALLTLSPTGSAAGGPPRAVHMKMIGANRSAKVTHHGEQGGVTNYMIGRDPSKWVVGVRGYERVAYEEIYPGINLVYYGNPREIEHDFIVSPGADPGAIAVEFVGADAVRLEESGDLLVTLSGLEVRQKRPIVYQRSGKPGTRRIEAEYVLDGTTVRFAVGSYDSSLPLIIDPVMLVNSTYLGGGGDERGGAIAVDASRAVYVAGHTASISYPLVNPLQSQHAGGSVPIPIDLSPTVPRPPWYANNWDLAISKYTPDGSALVYSTYLGGSEDEQVFHLAVGSSGEAVIAGWTWSADFPSGAGYQFGCPCPEGGFVVELNASGTALTYVSRLALWINGLALDAAGSAYLTGATGPSLPVVNAAQPQFGGGDTDAFLFVLNPTGTAPVYSTYLGGDGTDDGRAVVVAADGRVGVAGRTNSTHFPAVPPGQTRSGGPFDGYITWFDTGRQIERSTFLQGPYTLSTGSLRFGPDGSLYVFGSTSDDGFPAVHAMQPARAGQHDSWIVKYTTTGDVVYSTYVGGPWPDLAVDVIADAQGRVYLLGRTLVDWTAGPSLMGQYPQDGLANWDMTVVKLHASGALANAVRLGGTRNDAPSRLALGTEAHLYITGTTSSYDFPLAHPQQPFIPVLPLESYVTTGGGPRVRFDMFVTHVTMRMGPWPVTVAIPPGTSPRVTLHGEEFFGRMRVFIGGQWASDVVVHDRGTMSLTVPALPPGLYDIIVVDSYDELVALPNAIFYGTCEFTVPSTPQAFAAGGGTRAIQLTVDVPVCGWTAESPVDWISFAMTHGAGPADVTTTVQPNPHPFPRSAVVTLGGRPVEIAQAPGTVLDLNRDGLVDLIWRHDGDGRIGTWFMDGATQIRGGLLFPPRVEDLAWQIVGTGDFDADGQHDLVWQHVGDGRLAVWLMDGLTLKAGTLLTPSKVDDLDWRVRAVADLNADGHPDLIWHHRPSGLTAVWLMDGLTMTSAELLTAPVVADPAWEIAGAGDFTGPALFSPPDGQLDIVWQHRIDGRVTIWTMKGLVMTGGRDILNWFPDWEIQVVADLNRDHALDFVVRHKTSGQLRFVRYNPLVLTGTTIHDITPAFVEDAGWRIVGPR